MKLPIAAVPPVLGLALLSAVAGCGAPKASENAAASAVQAPADVPLATKPTVGQEASAVAANKLVIEFPEGGAALSPDAGKKLDTAARLFRDANPVAMYVAGHTDKSGSEFSNVLLSAKRAQAVKKGLVERGIPADRLLIQALGASEPADTSDPNAASNRRAVVTWRLL